MSKTTTTSRTDKSIEPLRPMTDAEVMAAALSDPDAQPLSPDDFKRMKCVPRSKIIRQALGLTRCDTTGMGTINRFCKQSHLFLDDLCRLQQ